MSAVNTGVQSLPLPAPISTGRIRLRSLILMRWVAVVGQTTTIFFVALVLRYDVPLMATLTTVVISVVINIILIFRYPASKRLTDEEAGFYLSYDILQLAALLYLTGGLHNPFAFLMLSPVIVAATTLSTRPIIILVGLTLVCASILVFVHFPLPWKGGEYIIPHTYVFGIWIAIVVGAVFFSINILRVAEEGRRMLDALAATQMTLARERELSAVSGLAAAAAHELGTPLGTISLVAKELDKELESGSPFAKDVKLLISQSKRCRDILEQLTLRAADGTNLSFHRMPIMRLAETVAHRQQQNQPIAIVVEHDPQLIQSADSAHESTQVQNNPQPLAHHCLEIIHALGNFVDNAVDFAKSRVTIRVAWSKQIVILEIIDDGPGYSKNILGALGEPYVSTRNNSDGMGLGIFIAKTLLEQTGAHVEFGGRHNTNGARIVVTWPRELFADHLPVASENIHSANFVDGGL